MQNEARGLERKGADIEERLLEFAVRVGKAIDTLPDTRLGRHIAGQLVRSGTSPAPNYAEACAAESKKDLALPQNLWVKGSNISRMEAFGFFAFPR